MGDYYFEQEVINKLDRILAGQGTQMAAIDDVTAAIAGLSTEITTFLADVAAQISGGLTEAEAETVVGQINGFTSQLQAADPANTPPPSTSAAMPPSK
jgi:hypothetical protein